MGVSVSGRRQKIIQDGTNKSNLFHQFPRGRKTPDLEAIWQVTMVKIRKRREPGGATAPSADANVHLHKYCIPLQQHLGQPAIPVVQAGDNE